MAEQLRAIDALLSGEMSAPDFESAFLSARTREINEGERPDGRLEEALSQIFFAVDRYVRDPDLRDQPEDLDDAGLVAAVREQRDRIS